MASGRYQSHFFNFLSRRSTRLNDQTGRLWRQTKLIALWGVQIVLYPIYVAFQTTRLAGKQLRQASRQVLPRLQSVGQMVQPVSSTAQPAPIADGPIRSTLKAVNELHLALSSRQLALQPDSDPTQAPGRIVVVGKTALAKAKSALGTALKPAAIATPSSTSVAPTVLQVQGIASLLTTRSIVLVTPANQVLDVLTPDQQAQLQRRMIGEMASYYRQQFLETQYNTPPLLTDTSLPVPSDRVNALPPIRWFWQTMAWMQTGPVASGTNLFQEASLQSAQQPLKPPQPLAIAATVAERSAEVSWQTVEGMMTELLDRSKTVGDRLAGWLKPVTTAIVKRPPSSLSPTEAAKPAETADSWLTMEELFQPPISPSSPPTPEREIWAERVAAQVAAMQNPAQWRAPASSPEGVLAYSTESALDRPPHLEKSYPLTKNRQGSALSTVNSVEPSTTKLTPVDRFEGAEMAIAPLDIETKAQLVAYEKHPLVQLLEWLDHGVLWLEQKVAQAWQWLRDRWNA